MLWAHYGKLSQDGVKGMVANPQNRAEPIKKLVEAFGGKLVSYHLLMNGEIDFFILVEMPDDKLVGTVHVNAMLVRASGAIKSITSVPAVLAEDAVPMMEKAKEMAAAMAYQSPK